VSSPPADSWDQVRPSNSGSATLQQHPDDALFLATSQFRAASSGDANDVDNGNVSVNLGKNPPSRLGADSSFVPRETSFRASTSVTQQGQPHLLSSPERRRHGPDNDYGARQPPYMSDREGPPFRDRVSYDRERDWEKELERNRERERDRRWSLSDHRRFDFDRRSFDNDRRPSSFDRRPPTNGDRRPLPVEDKRPPNFVDRRLLDDRRIPDYERPPLSEANQSRNIPSQDLPRGSHLGNERRPDATQAVKTHVSAPLTSSSAPSTGATVTSASVPAPVDPVADRMVVSDYQPTDGSPATMTTDSQHVSTPCLVEDRSGHVSSLHEPSSVAPPQLVPRTELARPGLSLEEHLSKPLETSSISPLPSTKQPLIDSSHTPVSEPLHMVDSRPMLNGDRDRYLLPAADDRTRPISAYSRAPSDGRDESRLHPLPLPPASAPSAVSSAQSSLSLHAREPSRERPSNFRPYFRSEFNRSSEDDHRLDGHPLLPSDSVRRYDERGRWSPPHVGDRRGYREYHDRDRLYWVSKDRARDRLSQLPPHPPPSHWDRERTRYSELSYTGLDKRFVDRDQGNRDRWYPPSYDDTLRRPFDTFVPRGRPRSPGSPNREFTELRPPPPKRARDDAYLGATGDAYYPRPHHPSSPPSSLSKDPLPPPPPSRPMPVPIPIPRPASPPPPLRYNHNRPPAVEMYGETYGGYDRDGGRGPTGPGYPREGTR
jgi:hypothetical protein